jgi:tetratricopeptide (TPR) repeat protein
LTTWLGQAWAADLEALWRTDPAAALMAAEGLHASSDDDPWLTLVLGRMLQHRGESSAAADRLLAAARQAPTRPLALISVASIAPQHHTTELLALFTSLPSTSQRRDELRYALGWLHWQAGEPERALGTWRAMSPEARTSLGRSLDDAAVQRGIDLLAAGRLADCLLCLEAVSPRKSPRATWLARALTVAALRVGNDTLAQRAAVRLAQSTSPFDAAVHQLAEGVGIGSLELFAAVQKSPAVPSLQKEQLVTAMAARLVLSGDVATARVLLSGSLEQEDSRVLAALVELVITGRMPLDVNWDRLRGAVAEVPGFVDRLVGQPESAGTLREAAFYFARGDLERADRLLAVAQRETPWDALIAKNRGLIAFGTALRARPQIDVTAWQKCIAQLASVLENPRALGAWVLRRIEVYQSRDSEEVREDVRVEVVRAIDNRLAELLSRARDDAEANQARQLMSDWTRERRAAGAMLESGAFRSPRGERYGFGPLFAAEAGLTSRLVEHFAATAPSLTDQQRDLRAHLEQLGISEDVLYSDPNEPGLKLRRYFSELGAPVCRRDAGAPAEARRLALDVLVRWSPPEDVDDQTFRRLNPAYAALPDGPAQLRRDARALICELSAEAFGARLQSASFEVEETAGSLRQLLTEAEGFGHLHNMRYRLARLVLGKRTMLVDEGTRESLRDARILVSQADEAGLEGMRPAILQTALAEAMFERNDGQLAAAVEAFREAGRLDPTHREARLGLLSSLIFLAEETRERAPSQSRQAAKEASTLAEQMSLDFPKDEQLGVLRLAAMTLMMGAPCPISLPPRAARPSTGPVSRGGEAQLPEAVVAAMDECRQHRRLGAFGAAVDAAERALEGATDSPDVIALAALVHLEAARRTAVDDGRIQFLRARDLLSGPGVAPAEHRHLAIAAQTLARDEVLYAHDGDPARMLHAKGLRLHLVGRDEEAVELLELARVLAPRESADLCSVLADSLMATVEQPTGDDEEARLRLDRAEQVLARGLELAPDHRGMKASRLHVAELRMRLEAE